MSERLSTIGPKAAPLNEDDITGSLRDLALSEESEKSSEEEDDKPMSSYEIFCGVINGRRPPGADVLIVTGPDHACYSFYVHSDVISAHSPVIKKMLESSEKQHDGIYPVLRLEEVDTIGFCLMMARVYGHKSPALLFLHTPEEFELAFIAAGKLGMWQHRIDILWFLTTCVTRFIESGRSKPQDWEITGKDAARVVGNIIKFSYPPEFSALEILIRVIS
ncbi:hypothetical protein TWF730_003633 [Orbilia blumenaviensis]|uniref:BTB domain-containing protein n=1 Tax=Orbilia blumenaviensis TaxID=1796055 RepID=A0AAV9U483_9PEZI